MDKEAVLRTLREATLEFYQLGLAFQSPMIAPVPERCVSVPAGPLRFVVEARHLNDHALGGEPPGDGSNSGEDLFDDYGPTLHVFGTADGIEHLRFDCFAYKPHYHYVQEGGSVNVVCRLDQYAEGDPVEWTIDRISRRLPEMLEHCGVSHLAQQVRQQAAQIVPVIDEVAELLRRAGEQARSERLVSHHAVPSS